MLRPLCASLLLALALGAVPAAAQTVGGSVLEEGSGAPVVGATVLVQQLRHALRSSAVTDSAGRFLLRLAPGSGAYLIRVTHPSYASLQDTLRLRTDESVQLQLRLGRDAIPVEAVVVTARRQRRLQDYYDRLDHGTGFGRFLTRAQLERIPANRTTDFLRRVPGIGLERSTGGITVTIDNPLGKCTPLIYIDGAAYEQSSPDLVDDALQPNMLEGIEVYAGTVGLPVQFAAAHQSGCGVVAFWTRDAGGRPLTWTRLLLSTAAIAAVFVTAAKMLLQ